MFTAHVCVVRENSQSLSCGDEFHMCVCVLLAGGGVGGVGSLLMSM